MPADNPIKPIIIPNHFSYLIDSYEDSQYAIKFVLKNCRHITVKFQFKNVSLFYSIEPI